MYISVRPTDILLRNQQLLSRLGYSSQPPFEVKTSLEKALFIASKLAAPEAVYLERGIIGFSEKGITIEGKHVFRTANIGRYISNCYSRIVIFIATIGSLVEDEVSRMMDNGDTLLAFILDAAGSQYVENFADYIAGYITARQPGGVATTRRYSPGYCDWGITDQAVIFRLRKPQKPGVTLNEKCLMKPLKSISGVMGLGAETVIAATPTPCQMCQDYNCPHRVNSNLES